MLIDLHYPSDIPRRPAPTVFLDRDGTLNVEKNYLYQINAWEWITGAQQAIYDLKKAGYNIAVVSNQSGIARGFYTKEDVQLLHNHVNTELHKIGAPIDAFFCCPHHPEHGDRVNCSCRKPKPGMLQEAAKLLNSPLKSCWMIGDKTVDLDAAHAAQAQGILVRTGHGAEHQHMLRREDTVLDSIVEAARFILSKK